ncbi:MAG: hypothetical protein KF862_16765 [Chitinophagaceae bacterium]|nr:hypothetical protein [Chitinophagaceae bacterium]
MEQYHLQLPENYEALVIHKREGIRRPVHFLFFKYKNKERLIAYTVNVQQHKVNNQYMIYKTKTGGKWLNGALLDGETLSTENKILAALKKAIDEYEGRISNVAYRELF